MGKLNENICRKGAHLFLAAAALTQLSCMSDFVAPDISDIVRNKTATYVVSSSANYSVHGGYTSSCAHPGAHAIVNPGTYPVYAVLDGVVANIDDCATAGSNSKYNITLAVAHKGPVTVYFEYSIEPFGGTSCNFGSQILVHKGDRVTKGQTIANFIAVGTGAHIHFDLKVDGATICPEIFPTTVFSTQTGTKSGCAAASANTFCYQLTTSEDPSRLL